VDSSVHDWREKCSLTRYHGKLTHSLGGVVLGIHSFWLFFISGLLFTMAPGQDVLYVASRSAMFGVRGGVTAAFGIWTGSFVHITAAAIGLSAVLAASATAFAVVKYAGAAYLVYSGARMILFRRGAPRSAPEADKRPPRGYRGVYVQGFFTNVLNVKVALYYLAFVPQFINHDAPHKALAFVALGLILNCTGFLWDMALAWTTARVASGFRGARRLGAFCTYAAGGLFVALGVKLALGGGS